MKYELLLIYLWQFITKIIYKYFAFVGAFLILQQFFSVNVLLCINKNRLKKNKLRLVFFSSFLSYNKVILELGLNNFSISQK